MSQEVADLYLASVFVSSGAPAAYIFHLYWVILNSAQFICLAKRVKSIAHVHRVQYGLPVAYSTHNFHSSQL